MGYKPSTAKLENIKVERTANFDEDVVKKYMKDIKEGKPMEPIILV